MAFNVCQCECSAPAECDQGAVYFSVCCANGEPCALTACARMLIQTSYTCDGDLIEPSACIAWTSGSSFAGTGDDGSVWTATLDSADDCGGDSFGRRVESASVSFGGRTITWTWDSGRNAYDVVTTGWSLCTTDCPAFVVTPAWVSRLWDDATRPDSIEVTFAGFDEAIDCCEYLNGTLTLDFVSGGTSCGLGDSWTYQYSETMPDQCVVTSTLIITSLTGLSCGANVQLYIIKTGTPMSVIPYCSSLWEITSPCEFPCGEVTLTQADFNAPIIDEDCCDATAATFSFTLPA